MTNEDVEYWNSKIDGLLSILYWKQLDLSQRDYHYLETVHNFKLHTMQSVFSYLSVIVRCFDGDHRKYAKKDIDHAQSVYRSYLEKDLADLDTSIIDSFVTHIGPVVAGIRDSLIDY